MIGCGEEKENASRCFELRFDLRIGLVQLRRRNMVRRISERAPDLFRRFDIESGSDSAV
jgi:hypothetical protein